MALFRWTKAKELAALLTADDKLSEEEIAARCGISDVTLWKWRKIPEFEARRQTHLAAYRERILTKSIANKQVRIEKLINLFDKYEQIIEARAADETRRELPGYSTGLMVVEFTGKTRSVKADTATTSEMRSTLKQVAQEMGEWVERHDSHTKNESIIKTEVTMDLTKLSLDDLNVLEHLALRALGPESDSRSESNS